MNKIILIVILIILIVVAIAVITFFTVSQKDGFKKSHTVQLQEILNKHGDTTYETSKEQSGKPKGGVLISIIDQISVCPEYVYSTVSGKNCLTDTSQCGDILDPADIDTWLKRVSTNGADTNCYQLCCSYLRQDMPNFVFGPCLSSDMVCGVLIDTQKIWDYIACMFPIDAGSVGRYNCSEGLHTCDFIDERKWISQNKGKPTSKQEWKEYLDMNDSVQLAQAGCGRKNPCGLIIYYSASAYIIPDAGTARDHVEEIRRVVAKHKIPSQWSINDDNRPFSKYEWSYWIEAAQLLFEKACEQGVEYINNQITNDDNGYKENEVNIIVPQDMNHCLSNGAGNCKATDEFKKVLVNSILGVVSVAEDHCSTSKSIAEWGPHGYGCSEKSCDIPKEMRTPCLDTNLWVDELECISNKDCCYERTSGEYRTWCYKSVSDPTTKCCCTVDFTEKVVCEMRDKFNNSTIRKKYGARKIKAYKLNIDHIYDFSWKTGRTVNLKDKLKEITTRNNKK